MIGRGIEGDGDGEGERGGKCRSWQYYVGRMTCMT